MFLTKIQAQICKIVFVSFLLLICLTQVVKSGLADTVSPLAAPLAASVSTVSGGIYTDTVWKLNQSPYLVTGNVTVFPGVTLTVEQGVEVRFAENTALILRGALNAVGTATQPITFTSNLAAPVRGSWQGIAIATQQGGKAHIRFSTLAYATAALSVECCWSGGPVTVADSTFRSNATALNGYAGWPIKVDRCIFENNGIGADSADKIIRDSVFVHNDYGLSQTERIDVYNTIFADNQVALSGGRGQVENSLVVMNEKAVTSSFEGFTLAHNSIYSNTEGVILGQYDGFSPPVHNNNLYGNAQFNLKNPSPFNMDATNKTPSPTPTFSPTPTLDATATAKALATTVQQMVEAVLTGLALTQTAQPTATPTPTVTLAPSPTSTLTPTISAKTLLFPYVVKSQNSVTSTLYIQNTGNDNMNAQATFYNQQGEVVLTQLLDAPIATSYKLATANLPTLPVGHYAVRITGDQPLAGVAQVEAARPGGGQPGLALYHALAGGEAASKLVIGPVLTPTTTSEIWLHNLNARAITITATFYANGGQMSGIISATLPISGLQRLANPAGLPANFSGWVHVTAEQPVARLLLARHGRDGLEILSAVAVPASLTRGQMGAFLDGIPFYKQATNGCAALNTTTFVHNPNGTSSQFTVTYRQGDGTVVATSTFTLLAFETRSFDAAAQAVLPNGVFIQQMASNQPFAFSAISDYTMANAHAYAQYRAGFASKPIFVPYLDVRDNARTIMSIQNLNSGDTFGNISYFRLNGSQARAPDSFSLMANTMLLKSYVPPDHGGLGDNQEVSLALSSLGLVDVWVHDSVCVP